MPKLNDTQTILLSTAAQRKNLSLYPLPAILGGNDTRISKALSGLIGGGWTEERQVDDPTCVARTDGEVDYGIFVTTAGLAAIGIEAEQQREDDEALVGIVAVSAPRVTKAATVLALLQREAGASLPDLIAATGWLPHTTRAALTGLRKKGHAIERFKRDEQTCYRVSQAA